MNTICWEVKHLSLPKVIRYCKKCGQKTQYIPAGLFRVNAQKKYLDIWLVYKCTHCQATWNMRIYSRVSPHKIGRDMLARFIGNDCDLANQYAMDIALLKQNGAEIEMPSYRILGDDIDLSRDARVRIHSQYPSRIRLSKILREKLSLSKKTFDAMVSNGMIRTENGADIRKCKLQSDSVIIINGSNANCPANNCNG